MFSSHPKTTEHAKAFTRLSHRRTPFENSPLNPPLFGLPRHLAVHSLPLYHRLLSPLQLLLFTALLLQVAFRQAVLGSKLEAR